MQYQYVIFDFDGTLADTASVIVATMHRTISALGLPDMSDARCRSMIGYRLEDIPQHLWPDQPDIAPRYVKTYREIFNTIKDRFKVNLYPHVAPTLAALHQAGVQMAIASSRSVPSLREYTAELGIADYFKQYVGGEYVKDGKPSPEPVNLILFLQQWDKNQTLVVGDMDVDILMGNRAGASTCGVTYGNGTVDQLQAAGANYIISDFSDLLLIITPEKHS